VNYTVVISVNNDQLKLMPGMTANVKILVASVQNVLKISNMALRFQPPADIVDTAKTNAMRGTMGGRGGEGDNQHGGAFAANGSDSTHASGDGGPATDARRDRFRALRDSIQAAHGGNLSDEDMRTEMRKVLGDLFRSGRPQEPQKPAAVTVKPIHTQFGIDLRFPEYQKSAYVPTHQTGRGRVWILNASGKLEPVFVKTGITDGKTTEIMSPTLKAGDQLVLGATNNGDTQADQARSPFTPQGGQRPGGGGGFR
jgi:HlyD family secretion protein